MNLLESRQNGFSLVELTVVLLLMTLIASVAVRQTTELGFQSRYELTRDRLDQIKQAILGDPKLVSNGQRAINGFVADMGRLPNRIQELIEVPGDCNNDAGDRSQTTCVNLPTPGIWTADPLRTKDPVSGLWYGWNGPYLDVSENPDADDAFTDGWGTQSDDGNYGWRFEPGLNPVFLRDGNPLNDQTDPDGLTRLVVQSLGLDQQLNGSDFDADFPANEQVDDAGMVYPYPLVDRQDWRVDVAGGIRVQFIKLNRVLPLSFCSDSTKTTQALCTSPNIWYGGCSLAGYYNEKSCEDALPTAGSWHENYVLEGAKVIGKGFGCSDQTITKKADCTGSRVWYACSDNSKTTQQDCMATVTNTWYGDDLNQISGHLIAVDGVTQAADVCLKLYYRNENTSIGLLISDSDKDTVDYKPQRIVANMESSPINFEYLRRADNGALVTQIPIGQIAIGIYQYDGKSCQSSTVHYPVHHQSPILVDLYPKTYLPVINW